MASLLFLAGPNTGRRYNLGEGEYVIGRRPDCHIFVPDLRVSRQHARLRLEGESNWCLEDLGSNNGTFVNGERVQSINLHDQDEITIARNRIRVEFPGTERARPTDSHVTIVDLHNPKIFTSREQSETSGTWRPNQSSSSPRVGDSNPELRFVERKLAAVSQILELVANTPDPNKLLEAVVIELLEVFPQADSVGVLVDDERTGELKVKCHKQRERRSPFGFSGDLKVPATIISHVVRDRRGILLAETPMPELIDKPGPNGDLPQGSRMGAPLQAHESNYGVVYVECQAGTFEQEDVDLLTSIAAQAGLAMHTARMHEELMVRERLERDIRVARQIQRSLLPKTMPDVLGMDFAVHYEPAYEIGGDFYDFIWHDDSHLGIVVGDVAGKAISAALYMARLTSELRSRAGISRSPARLLARVNEEMVALGDDGMFATLAYVIYDLNTRTLTFTNAGHVAPLLRRDGRVIPLHSERAHIAPVGIMPDMEVGQAKLQLHSGDLLVLATDGIHEARDARGNEYGGKRLARRIRSARGRAVDVVQAILQDVDSHIGSGTQADDVTLVAMQVGRHRARRRTDTNPILDDSLPPSQDDS